MSVDALTPSSAGSLTGPQWLVDQRVAAAERFASATLPDASLEEWRYSRVGDLDLDRFTLADPGSAADVPADALALSDRLGGHAGRIVLVDGRLVLAELDPDLAERGVRFGRLSDSDVALGGTTIAPTVSSSEHVVAADPFSDLNLAHGTDPLLLSVPRNITVDLPFHIVSIVGTEAVLVLPRLVVDAGENSDFSVVEWSTSSTVDALVVPRFEVTVGPAARVGVVTVNAWGPATHQLGAVSASVGQEATLRLSHVALGGSYARNRFDCRLVGRGATGRLSALYLGDDDQMHDLRTFQTHEARDTTSDLLFKGALDDRAHAVYTGMIRVDHEGQGSNANQTNRVIKLSDDAWAESVPNLEINHNDVRCSHATAVGPIDEDQRFYLESRGVPPEAAERLVVNGFFEEVLDTIGVGAVVDLVRPLIVEKLDSADETRSRR